jgi:hypothetical protein
MPQTAGPKLADLNSARQAPYGDRDRRRPTVARKVLVLGSNFAGLTAALAIKHELQDDVEVTVISKDDRFVFNPSFIGSSPASVGLEVASMAVSPA